MPRTLEELDRELDALRAELEALKQREAARVAALRQLAGCFSDDPDWTAIHEAIEEQRRQPASEIAQT
jgi:hypothetical protein